MMTVFEDYTGALKMAFTRACENTNVSEWGMVSAPAIDMSSRLVCDFINERTKLLLHVIYEGTDSEGANLKFKVEGKDINMNMSVPSSWKGMKFH